MISKFRRLGIKTKWMIYTFVFIISFSSILVSFFITTGKKDLEKELKKWGKSLARSLADNACNTVQTRDYATLKSYLYGLMNYKEIIYSVIIDKSGSILAIEDPRSMLTSKILDQSLNLTAGKVETIPAPDGTVYYNIVEPILIANKAELESKEIHFDPMERVVSELNNSRSNNANQRLGAIILGISLEEMNIKLDRMRNKAIYIAFLSTLVVFAFVFWGVGRLTKPIKDLDQATRKVAQGDLNHAVEINRIDELGRLAHSFNDMILKLKESQQEIENYTHTLENKVAERTHELQVSEQKYRTLFEHAGTAVALVDEDGNFQMVNNRYEILSGYSGKELVQKKSLAEFLSPEDCQKIRGLCINKKNFDSFQLPIIHECTFFDQDRHLKKVNLTISQIPGDKNLLVSIVDVTELRELQKRLARSAQLATLGELSAAVAHEIRNPLVAIKTSVGILKNTLNLVGEDEELMNIISEESMRLNKIVDDFLKFARPNEPQFINADINILIQETFLLLKSRLNGIHTHLQLNDRLPLISSDPDQIKQVLMNILINAIEAMPRGGSLAVATQFHLNKTKHPCIEIKIKDSGMGILETDIKKIFQPFFSTKKNGIGMGLAVCERIIQNHDGTIQVESQYGKGTQFTVVLPMKNNS
jgi:PAS domain S-box-containing protein